MGLLARLSTRRSQCQCALASLSICAALTAPASISGADKPIVFAEVSAEVGVTFVHPGSPTREKYLVETIGAGVAVLDYDNDGQLDLFFVNGAY